MRIMGMIRLARELQRLSRIKYRTTGWIVAMTCNLDHGVTKYLLRIKGINQGEAITRKARFGRT